MTRKISENSIKSHGSTPSMFQQDGKDSAASSDALDWPMNKLAYCRILFTDVDAHKAVYMGISANSDNESFRSEAFGRSDSADFIFIDHFDDVFKGYNRDYVSALITSRSSADIDVVLQFIFTDDGEPETREYPLSLKQDEDEIVFFPVNLT